MSLITSRVEEMSKQTGFTLIEILVTVIVLSIGLLGLAGLQAVALKFNSASYQRSQATVLIYDMIERMRVANPNSRLATTVCIKNGACADPNIQQWLNVVAATLPGAPVPDVNLSGGVLTVQIQWNDSRGQNESPAVRMETIL